MGEQGEGEAESRGRGGGKGGGEKKETCRNLGRDAAGANIAPRSPTSKCDLFLVCACSNYVVSFFCPLMVQTHSLRSPGPAGKPSDSNWISNAVSTTLTSLDGRAKQTPQTACLSLQRPRVLRRLRRYKTAGTN